MSVIFWMALSVVLFFLWENRKTTNAESKSEKILSKADRKRDHIINDARKEADSMVQDAKWEAHNIMNKAQHTEDRIAKTESRVIEREEKIEKKLDEISAKQDDLVAAEEKLRNQQSQLDKKRDELDAVGLVEKHKKKIEKQKIEISREILLKSIQQYAGDVTSEVTTTLIPIPSDDIKGKLIGKEGRNITTFEKNAGVSLIIDDTPDSVFISAFDLYRRYIAKKSLEKLIEDWRIQPARIEEVVKQTESDGETLLKDLWNKVLDELNINNMPDEIIPIIGRLRFRTSYGQNMLKHSKEVAIIAEAIAGELGVDKKIVQVADAISSVRPWARREASEQYLKRVQEMEALVQSFSWVDKAYALSAWREVRVFVNAETISDTQAHKLAGEIAENIEENLQYPWEVKVSLIREMRCVEYAK